MSSIKEKESCQQRHPTEVISISSCLFRKATMTWALLHHAGNEKWNNATCSINWKMHIILLLPSKMTLEVYSWHTPGLQIGKGAETRTISCHDCLISQPQRFWAQGSAWAAASLPEKHPTLVEILETQLINALCQLFPKPATLLMTTIPSSTFLLIIHYVSQTLCTWIIGGDILTLLAFKKIHISLDRHL